MIQIGRTCQTAVDRVCRRPVPRRDVQKPHVVFKAKRGIAFRCKAEVRPEESDDVGGNKDVQDALLESLRLGIKRQETKDEVEQSFQQEVQKLRDITEQAKEELEAVAKLNSMRQELAFGSTLADLLQDVDAMQEELRKSREQTEADQREFEQWEKDTSIARSQGLFFQSLHAIPKSKDTIETKGGAGRTADEILQRETRSQAAAQAREAIHQVSQEEVASPWRLYVLSYMILALVLFASYDLVGPHPSLMRDGVLAVLALVMGVAAWNERQVVLTMTAEEAFKLSQAGKSKPAVEAAQSGKDSPSATVESGEEGGGRLGSAAPDEQNGTKNSGS